MSLDPTIREQTYQYFLQEASELLQAIEQGLFSLRENWGIPAVNNLMRATHTLKGAATSVGLETIARIAHSLEDVFKALCQPNLSLDPEVEALLFEGLECLRLPLIAELTGSAVDDAEVLNRTATIFALLEEKLGDCFGQEPYLPTSAELGFDLTQSMFELGVSQRLEQIAALLNAESPEAIAIELKTHAEVLLGLAESLNLSGFGEIAKTTIAALHYHPDQAIVIAQAAYADFQAGQTAVLSGDRTHGGEPSPTLQMLATPPVPPLAADLPLEDLTLLESIWGSSDADPMSELIDSDAIDTPFSLVESSPPPEPRVSPLRDPLPKDSGSPLPSVRVAIKHLDQFNYALGEFVTEHNRQTLQIEQLQTIGKTLLHQVKRHQQMLTQLQNQTRRTAHSSPVKSSRRSKKGRGFDPAKNQSDQTNAIQSLLDQTVQLSESAEAIRLMSEQMNQRLEKQQKLLSSTQDALIEARMLPLGEIFGRFPQTLHQLETFHSKPVALNLRGSDVLVDKAVAEKLFDPLLHLVRNAFDHGIEASAIRQQRGKAQKGSIELAAYHHGRHLVIEIQDDGNGIDFDHIRQRAIEQQRLSIEQANQMSQDQLAELLFEPGFSTAAQLSDLSGRGVGLDVVRNQLDALQGTISIRSERYQGTTFTLRIPLKLSIAQLFVCEANRKPYALLDDAIEQILIPRSGQIVERNGGKFLRWGQEEQLIPIYSFAEAVEDDTSSTALLATSEVQPSNPVILIRWQHQLLGLEVDRVISEQKLVIRPLGAIIHPPSYVQGATPLADGRLALVIDATMLLQRIVSASIAPPIPRQAAEMQLVSSPLPAARPELSARPNTKILVVEDSITTRQSLVLTLGRAGYQVIEAQDGREGLDCFQRQPDIQLVICDVEMPNMNGFEFLRNRQQVSGLTDIPVLMLSSRSDEKHRLLASQLGATVYMVKPFMEPKLLEMVTTLVQHSQINIGTA
ncbi:hybrid sensor histidine kinase/response regulator [Leptolyngbya sp. AN03gr2]|uniref:hybrid sensor histidine kinase/response regulator n=1 Tax=unclassified Leptolyngbya TaxID=2650499 RepID=UPI003D31C082